MPIHISMEGSQIAGGREQICSECNDLRAHLYLIVRLTRNKKHRISLFAQVANILFDSGIAEQDEWFCYEKLPRLSEFLTVKFPL